MSGERPTPDDIDREIANIDETLRARNVGAALLATPRERMDARIDALQEFTASISDLEQQIKPNGEATR